MNLGIQTINNEKFVLTHGVQIYPASFDTNRKISNLSFSDDIAPIVKSKESAKAALEMLDKFSEWSGTIKFAPHKFETIGFQRQKHLTWLNRWKVQVQDTEY